MSKRAKIRQQSKKESEQTTRKVKTQKSLGIFNDSKLWVPIVAILAITTLIYLPSVLNNQFVNWDDDVNLLENESIRKLTMENIIKIFTSDVIGNYNPLPILTFAIEYALVEYKPFLYHFNNLWMHLLVVFLVYKLTLQLGVQRTVAIAVAALFALHPMRVESVAWVTERKDVLFSLFFFSALINYVKYIDHPKDKKYLVWVYLLFILSLLSKIQAVALPLSMLAIDYWRGRDINFKLILEKIPYFILSLAIGLLGIYMLAENESLDQTKTQYSIIERLFIGSWSFVVYWYKLLVPYPMSPLYPYPKQIPWYFYASAIGTIGIVVAMFLGFIRKWKAWTFGTFWFGFNIVFLLQILGAGQGFLADRFTYVAYYGLFFTLAWYWNNFFMENHKRKTIGMAIGIASIIIYSILTFQQTKIWENGDTLWTHVLKYFDNADTPYRNRGNYHRDNGNFEKALMDYNALLRIDPTNGAVYNSVGKAYFEQQNWKLALEAYENAVKYTPEKGEYWVNLSATKASMGDLQGAIDAVSKGIELEPNHTNGHQTRFLVRQAIGDIKGSIDDLTELIKLKPQESGYYYERGRAHFLTGNLQVGIQDMSDAIKVDPKVGMYYLERGKALLETGNKTAAKSDFTMAQQLGQTVDQALLNLVQ
jgi:tetratricopeptide (TPR) repeat protein